MQKFNFIFIKAFFFSIFILLLSSCDSELFAPDDSTNDNFVEYGIASYYADLYEGRPTASGEIFRQDLMTAAHKTLPFGTMLTVTNLANGKSIRVRVNDRGPFVAGRIIDLTRKGAEELDFIRQGLTDVRIEAD
ncbi:MAG: septal ring lytic transglycosylase RlpA family protein [Bernardetiaceae bacterium]|nr:septal ring lytic transglycosylase RlpA family protein [Bernardetiaceae bacterium]